jgi:hypothetical protein
VAHHQFRVAAEREALHAAPSVRAHHDEVAAPLDDLLHDQFRDGPRGRVEHDALAPESGVGHGLHGLGGDRLAVAVQRLEQPAVVGQRRRIHQDRELVDDVEDDEPGAGGERDADRFVQAAFRRRAAVDRDEDA